MDAAKILHEQYGMEAEVIDIRFVNPLNYDKLVESVKKTGRLLLSCDAAERGSVLNTIAANVQALAFDYLDAPVAMVGSRNWVTPQAEMEGLYFPQTDWILDAIHERIVPLKAADGTPYAPKTVQTSGELARRNRLGV
jgi:2-oxoisovalerate dehydrogenase E1 component